MYVLQFGICRIGNNNGNKILALKTYSYILFLVLSGLCLVKMSVEYLFSLLDSCAT